jgi:transposase
MGTSCACSPDAGPRAAVLYTLVASAARHDLDVWAYLCDLLERLAVMNARTGGSQLSTDELVPLLPDVWAKEHPESIRRYRRHERENRATAKRTRREKRRALARARAACGGNG